MIESPEERWLAERREELLEKTWEELKDLHRKVKGELFVIRKVMQDCGMEAE